MSAVWTGKLEANMLERGDTAGTIIAHHVELQIISEQKWNDLVGAAKAGRPGRSEYRNLPVRQGVADAVMPTRRGLGEDVLWLARARQGVTRSRSAPSQRLKKYVL